MSGIPVSVETCANCGKVSGNAVKLKNCMACRLVKYCSVDCQKAHRKQHKKACKRRVAELKDEQLYSQGHERSEDAFCPLCTLPIALPMNENSGFNECCTKRVCYGCVLAAQKSGMFDTCPFCRAKMARDDASALDMARVRAEKKDPAAIEFLGSKYYYGTYGVKKNVPRAIELLTEAAELGSIDAHAKLGQAYLYGMGVAPDNAKGVHHFELAAMKGSVESRHNLGCYEAQKGNYERAVRHWLISAKMGNNASLDNVKDMLKGGVATKEQYAEALKGYQDSVEETKSPGRDEAKQVFRVRDECKTTYGASVGFAPAGQTG
ncbi:hypothetical protein THAOC_07831 [Thalassiosira oceanica]|uniref:MYND-type domain-containing protein n=1 Tax=Thalassiosira oceanica TaxID=159749 RepID=K0TJL3_THAOC|nr:hypothetical protein THAOC_07831 [Thalassiosira oceanica]|eukprot:EJK70782.1 hypothetical protein THAOC_07831 [Thalassiosira oceanica]